jgi:hypothetical protein
MGDFDGLAPVHHTGSQHSRVGADLLNSAVSYHSRAGYLFLNGTIGVRRGASYESFRCPRVE